MPDRQGARKGAAVYGLLVRTPSDPEPTECIASLCNCRSRPQQRRAHSRAQICRLNGWCAALLIISSCCLPFALSGCGGKIVLNGTALTASPNAVTFGAVSIGQTASTPVSLLNRGIAPVQITQLNRTGQSFSVDGPSNLPVTIAAGGTYSLNVQFNPVAAGAATGQLTIASNSSTAGTPVISLSGTGTTGTGSAALSALYCSSGAMAGSGTDACTVTLTVAAPSGGLLVNLSTSSSAVTVSSTVTVPAGATSAEFTAAVSSVATAQVVTMTASAGGILTSFTLQLNAAILGLSINATSVAFGDVVVNTPATQPVTLTSTGTGPVTINEAAVTGAGFTMSGAELPTTLNPNQQMTLNIGFDPTAVGAATGQLVIAGTSSTNGTAVIGLRGTGTSSPAVAVAVTPANASTVTGASQQFAASVTGTLNTSVTWTVSGTGCSGATCGTISSTGLYTAPAVVPSPATVTITATSVLNPSKSASASVTIVLPAGAAYYLAPAAAGGNDSNNGLSPNAPWLTPNHAVNCGDTLTAAAGTYSAANFGSGVWGTVTCAEGNNVAWVQCVKFDACKIAITTTDGFHLYKSYWGVQGWEVDGSGASAGSCFIVYPDSGSINHIIFANDIASGCGTNGFSSSTKGSAGVDYLVIVGNIVYNAAFGSAYCGSGISIYEPVASDSLPGTHEYVAGNFSFGNFDGNPCNGTAPTDGNGIIFDTFDGSQTGLPIYDNQAVIDNNILIANGGRGMEIFNNANGSGPFAKIYERYNTVWGNNLDANPTFASNICSEALIYMAFNVESYNNIVATSATDGCNGGRNPIYSYSVSNGNGTDQVYQDVIYGMGGTTTNTNSSTGFSYGPNNLVGTSPVFANASIPSAPSCGSYSSVPACTATLIANFTPTSTPATGYGYQTPSSTSVYDPLYPQWLCNITLPSGLVTPGCAMANPTTNQAPRRAVKAR